MHLLYYWRGDNYRADLDEGAAYNLNQSSETLHDIALGESLWAFTRRQDGAYVLAAELVICAKTLNDKHFKYGRYRVWGDLALSRYFNTHEQHDITELVRGLSVSAKGSILGQAFRGKAAVRRLLLQDHQILSAYASALSFEPRAHLLPEESLEYYLSEGQEEAVTSLLAQQPLGISPARRHYLEQGVYFRSRDLVRRLKGLYAGQCQLCRWPSQTHYGNQLCEAHHIQWLSRGGEDELHNLVLLCPNHHRAVHHCTSAFDIENRRFVINGVDEPLELDAHRLVA